MPLRASQIAELLRDGSAATADDPLIITPSPDLVHLSASGAASVDLRLGTWFMSSRQSRTAVQNLSPASQPTDQPVMKTHYVPFGRTFVLHPRSFVLAATLEWVRLPLSLAGSIVGRSSWGRRGLIIATASGIHPGFTGCLTLELANLGEIPMELGPGSALCQLFLDRVPAAADADKSVFAGLRRPTLGHISFDQFSLDLATSPAAEVPGGA